MSEQTHTPDKREQAEFIASRLMLIHPILLEFDLDFIKQCAKDMYNDASRMDSAAVLIRNYSPTKSQLLQTQGKAMELLAEYIETISECGALKTLIAKEEQNHNEISKMFGL